MTRTFLSQSPLTLVVLAACLQTTGCMGRQTGSEIDHSEGSHGGDGLPYCDEVKATKLAADETPSGSSLNEEVLSQAIAGEFEMELAWKALNSADVVVTPGSGDTEISVTIEPISGTAEWVEMTVVQPESDNGGNGIELVQKELVCSNVLRMEAKITVKTANGAFDDTFVGKFSTSDGHVARAEIPLSLAELTGSFDVDVSALENGKVSPQLSLAIGYGSLSGRIGASIESQGAQSAMQGGVEVGVFPKNNPCEWGGTLIGTDSVLAESVDAALKVHTAFDFTWQGEDSFEVDVVPTLTAMCLAAGYSGEPGAISGSMTLDVTSSGGEIDGTWPLTVMVELDEAGEPTRLDVTRNSYMVDSFSNAEFEEKTGIKGISSNAEELSFSFGYSIDLVEALPASGELTVLEMMIPDCAREGQEPEVIETPDGGSSSNGCEGIDVVESKFAQLLER